MRVVGAGLPLCGLRDDGEREARRDLWELEWTLPNREVFVVRKAVCFGSRVRAPERWRPRQRLAGTRVHPSTRIPAEPHKRLSNGSFLDNFLLQKNAEVLDRGL